MQLIEWEVAEDGYQEQIVIPKEKRDLAAGEGIEKPERFSLFDGSKRYLWQESK